MAIILRTEPGDQPGVTRVILAVGVDRQSIVEINDHLFDPGMEDVLMSVLDAVTAQDADPSTVEYGPKRKDRGSGQA